MISFIKLYCSINILLLFIRHFLYEVDCVWGEYGELSACSTTCGDGTRTRTITEEIPAANGAAECSGSRTEAEACNNAACPGGKIFKDIPNDFQIRVFIFIINSTSTNMLNY